jgi:hypothetical protein
MIKFRVLLFPLLLCFSYTVFAQVYKSTDAEGNVTFSDTPSADSKAVEVEKANVADPVKVPENTSPAPEPKVVKTERPPEAATPKNYGDEDEYYGDDDDGYYGVRPRVRQHRRRMGHRRR